MLLPVHGASRQDTGAWEGLLCGDPEEYQMESLLDELYGGVVAVIIWQLEGLCEKAGSAGGIGVLLVAWVLVLV